MAIDYVDTLAFTRAVDAVLVACLKIRQLALLAAVLLIRNRTGGY